MSIDAEFTIFAIGRSLCSVEKEARKLLSSVNKVVESDFSEDVFNELFGRTAFLGLKRTHLLESDPPEEINKETGSHRRSANRIERLLRHAEKRLVLWKPREPEVDKHLDVEDIKSVELLIEDICNMSSLSNFYCTKQEMQNVLITVDKAVDAITSKFGSLDTISDLLLGSIVKNKLCSSIFSDLNKTNSPMTWTNIRKALHEWMTSIEEAESKKLKSHRPTCYACRKYHILLFCPNFQYMTSVNRWKLVKQVNICANCFSAHHLADNCDKLFRCSTCGEAHNSLLHSTKNPFEM